MPRVNFVKKARKDYPDDGIKKGESYYWWKFRYGGKYMSKTMPRPSQLTQGKMSDVYAAQESIEDAMNTEGISLDDLRDTCETAANDIQIVADEYRDSASNIESTFSNSPKADECNEKADNLESVASELQSINFDMDDEEDKEAFMENVKSEIESALSQIE